MAVLGPEATAEWNRRAKVTITVEPGVQRGMSGTFDLNAQTIDLNPK